MTDEQKFLAWCKENKLKPRKEVESSADQYVTYFFIIKAILLQDNFTLELNQTKDSEENLTFHFDLEGRCFGSSRLIESTWPWEK